MAGSRVKEAGRSGVRNSTSMWDPKPKLATVKSPMPLSLMLIPIASMEASFVITRTAVFRNCRFLRRRSCRERSLGNIRKKSRSHYRSPPWRPGRDYEGLGPRQIGLIPQSRPGESLLPLEEQSVSFIYLDTYMRYKVYKKGGICLRNHCRAEPPGDIEPPGLFPTVGRRDRAPASYAAADRLKAPASAA